MASNYVQLNWLEPSWDDDQVGNYSSLERRQRKAAEKQDVNAFYSTLGFLFVIVLALLVWIEISAVATEPSGALTGAFLLELLNSVKLFYSQLRILYDYAKEVGLTCLAVVYGPDYQRQGLDITHGAAKLLAKGLYYLAVLLSGILMCSTIPHVVHAPLRTATLTTLAAGLLFGAPPTYALVVSHVCQKCVPQSVVLLAFLAAALMCLATNLMGRSIGRRLTARRAHSAQSARSRGGQPAAQRRQGASGSTSAGGLAGANGAAGAPASRDAVAGGGGSGGAGSCSGSGRRAGGAGASAPAAPGRPFSRASSSSTRSGGGGGGSSGCGAAAGFGPSGGGGSALDPTRPAATCTRSPSTSSFSASGSAAAAAAYSGTTANGNGIGSSQGSSRDPTALPATRSAGRLAYGGTSPLDPGPGLLCQSRSQPGGSQPLSVASRSSGSITPHPPPHSAATAAYDPVAARSGGGMAPGSATGRGANTSSSSSGTIGAGSGIPHIAGNGPNAASAASGVKGAGMSSSSSSKPPLAQQQSQNQRHGSSGPSWPSLEGPSTAGGKAGKPSAAAPNAPASRAAAAHDPTAIVKPSAAHSCNHSLGTAPKPTAAADPTAAPGAKKKTVPGSCSAVPSSFRNGATAALALSRGGPAGAAATAAGAATASSTSASAARGPAASAGTAAGPGTLPAGKAASASPQINPVAATGATGSNNGTGTSVSATAAASAGAKSQQHSSALPYPAANGSGPAISNSSSSNGGSSSTTGTTSLFSRLTSSVAPALTGRGAKKVPAAGRKQPPPPPLQALGTQQQQQQVPPLSSIPQQSPPPLAGTAAQYAFVPPPPPPPRKSSPSTADAAAAAGGGFGAGNGTSTSGGAVRNAWLNPNPVIKLPAGVAKGPRGAAAGNRTTTYVNVGAAAPAANVPAAAVGAADAPLGTRSGGGACPVTYPPPPPPSSSARSASCGGFMSTDSPLLSSRSSGATTVHVNGSILTSCSSPSAAAPAVATQDPVAQPPAVGSPVTKAVGEPFVMPTSAAAVLAAQQHQQHASPRSQQVSGGGGCGAFEHVAPYPHPYSGLVSTTIVASSEPFMPPLVAHKHASGDLDIASIAADYRPYSSSNVPPVTTVVAGIATDMDSDSFSFFSTPPPVISGPAAGADAAAATAAAVAGVLRDADAPAVQAGGMTVAMYGAYGAAAAGNFTSLSTFAADPVWSPNVPVLAPLFPSAAAADAAAGMQSGGGAAAARAPRLPPPGFPSHAYGGAFATGPFPGGAWGPHPPPGAAPTDAATAAAKAAAAARAPTADSLPLPLPPASGRGSLASLGFVEDTTDSNSGGGEDGAGSCTICWSAPRQVGFLHGKTSHLCVCRRCAAQLREGVHRCPMCRQLIERIIDIF